MFFGRTGGGGGGWGRGLGGLLRCFLGGGGCLLFGWLFVRGVSFLFCFPWAAFSASLSNICSFCLSRKKKIKLHSSLS